MDFDEFSDEEDREARMYAMLHYIDSEITQTSVPPNQIISEKDDSNNTNNDLSPINIPTTNKSSLIVINCDEPFTLVSHNNENGTENSKNLEKSKETSNPESAVENIVNVSLSGASDNVKAADNPKQTSKIDLSTGESGKKKISHAGRYWDTDNSETIIKEVNLPYQKVNKPVHKQPLSVQSPDVVGRRSDTLITLTDKRASKRRSSENAASVQNDTPFKSVAAITERRKSATKPCRVVIETLPVLQSVEKGSKKNSSSLLLTNVESMISSKTKKKNSPKTPISTKKSKRIMAEEYNVIAADRNKTLLLLKSTSSSKKARSARKENDTYLAEMSLKKKYAKTVKNPFSTSIKQDPTVITLESSDEDDDVIEVELPPNHPTTIELDSSDESPSEEILDIVDPEIHHAMSTSGTQTDPSDSARRKDGVSPVPSIVSSVSDDFIQGDCSTLNISQGYDTSNLTFNFGLHGTDLCEVPIDITPSKSGKKSKKNSSTCTTDTEDIITKSTSALTKLSKSSEGMHLLNESPKETLNTSQIESECFATPRSKIKKRRNSKPKSYTVPDQAYVTPSIDVYESESSDIPESLVDVPVAPVSKKKRKSLSESFSKDDTVSSTSGANEVCYTPPDEEDSLIMANVVGLPSRYINREDDTAYVLNDLSPDEEIIPSTTITKHRSKTSKSGKRTKLEKCIRHMHKYYNTNWGADFDHMKLKQEMPKDRDSWTLDAADRARPRKVMSTCGFCNKTGHRSEFCYRKPQVCSMCGCTGHRDIKCPNKICLNCGSPNSGFTTSCVQCRNWRNVLCNICREYGHPSPKCPDTWRRYHLTTTNEAPLIEDKRRKPHSQLFCSGCTRRGHLIIDCQNYISFSDFKPASPFVFCYKPIITPDGVRAPPRAPPIPSLMSVNTGLGSPQIPGRIKSANVQETLLPKWNKRLGPANERNLNIENHVTPVINKTRSISIGDNEPNKVEGLQISFSNARNGTVSSRKVVDLDKISDFPRDESNTLNASLENPSADSKSKSPDLQSSDLGNGTNLQTTHDFQTKVNINLAAIDDKIKSGHIRPTDIGDENSTTSHLLLTFDHANKLSNPEGEKFLKYLSDKYNITAQKCVLKVGTSLVLAGSADKHLDFQSEMQSWMNVSVRVNEISPINCIPRKRNEAVDMVLTNIRLLESDLGNPKFIYQSIRDTERNIEKSGSGRKVNGIKYLLRCKKLNKLRKSLNMILIGQAGFCNGAENLNKLNLLVDDLKKKDYVELDSEMRDKISQCYESLFSAAPRDDYPQLIDKYYGTTLIQPSPTIQHPSQTKKNRSLLIRLRVVIERLLKAARDNKGDKQLGVKYDFLLEWEHKILGGSLSVGEFKNITNAISNADNYISTLKLQKKKGNKKKKKRQANTIK